jgi:hypothetical protein
MVLKVTSAGATSVERVEVKRAGPDLFRLLSGSAPTTPPPPSGLPTDPVQPFICNDSDDDLVTGGQTSWLVFDNSGAMSESWRKTFRKRRTVRLRMEVPGKPSEHLDVILSCADVAKDSVRSASFKVLRASNNLLFAIGALFRTIALRLGSLFTRHRRDSEPEMLPANGPQNVE